MNEMLPVKLSMLVNLLKVHLALTKTAWMTLA